MHGYMAYIQQCVSPWDFVHGNGLTNRNAEQAVRNMLLKAANLAGTNVLEAIDYLDDGSPICLKVTIDQQTGDAVFDFEGTGAEVRGNLNAPIAVVHSAIIYWSVMFPGLSRVQN